MKCGENIDGSSRRRAHGPQGETMEHCVQQIRLHKHSVCIEQSVDTKTPPLNPVDEASFAVDPKILNLFLQQVSGEIKQVSSRATCYGRAANKWELRLPGCMIE